MRSAVSTIRAFGPEWRRWNPPALFENERADVTDLPVQEVTEAGSARAFSTASVIEWAMLLIMLLIPVLPSRRYTDRHLKLIHGIRISSGWTQDDEAQLHEHRWVP